MNMKKITLMIPDDVPMQDYLGKMVEVDGKSWITLLNPIAGNFGTGEVIFTSALFDHYVRNAEKKTLREIVENE